MATYKANANIIMKYLQFFLFDHVMKYLQLLLINITSGCYNYSNLLLHSIQLQHKDLFLIVPCTNLPNMIRQEYDSAEVINIRVVDGYSFISV